MYFCPTKTPSTPNKAPSKPTKTLTTPTKTPRTQSQLKVDVLEIKNVKLSNTNLRCYVGGKFLSRIYPHFGKLFTGSKNVVVYRKWQIWGMCPWMGEGGSVHGGMTGFNSASPFFVPTSFHLSGLLQVNTSSSAGRGEGWLDVIFFYFPFFF